jgi:hypothetical protein
VTVTHTPLQQSSKQSVLSKRKLDDPLSSSNALAYSNENIRHPNSNSNQAKRLSYNTTPMKKLQAPLALSASGNTIERQFQDSGGPSSSDYDVLTDGDYSSDQMVPETTSLIQYKPGRFRF